MNDYKKSAFVVITLHFAFSTMALASQYDHCTRLFSEINQNTKSINDNQTDSQINVNSDSQKYHHKAWPQNSKTPLYEKTDSKFDAADGLWRDVHELKIFTVIDGVRQVLSLDAELVTNLAATSVTTVRDDVPKIYPFNMRIANGPMNSHPIDTKGADGLAGKWVGLYYYDYGKNGVAYSANQLKTHKYHLEIDAQKLFVEDPQGIKRIFDLKLIDDDVVKNIYIKFDPDTIGRANLQIEVLNIKSQNQRQIVISLPTDFNNTVKSQVIAQKKNGWDLIPFGHSTRAEVFGFNKVLVMDQWGNLNLVKRNSLIDTYSIDRLTITDNDSSTPLQLSTFKALNSEEALLITKAGEIIVARIGDQIDSKLVLGKIIVNIESPLVARLDNQTAVIISGSGEQYITIKKRDTTWSIVASGRFKVRNIVMSNTQVNYFGDGNLALFGDNNSKLVALLGVQADGHLVEQNQKYTGSIQSQLVDSNLIVQDAGNRYGNPELLIREK